MVNVVNIQSVVLLSSTPAMHTRMAESTFPTTHIKRHGVMITQQLVAHHCLFYAVFETCNVSRNRQKYIWFCQIVQSTQQSRGFHIESHSQIL